MATDYYELLGVNRDATNQDIKTAFRQIARECHPDVSGGDPDAEERFKKARIAYETLMDPVTRARYDRRFQRRGQAGRGGSFFDAFYKQTGERGAQGGSGFSNNVSGGPPRGARPKKNDPRNDIGLDDLFNVGEFGFGSATAGASDARNPAPPPRNQPTNGGDVEIELDVPADIAARGGSVTAVYYRMQRADSWRPGTDDAGLVRVQDIADIRIVPGTRQGTVLRERGLGDAGAFGGSYGDLVARVRIVGQGTPRSVPPPPGATAPPPPSAVRAGHEPEVAVLEISVVEALLGGRVSLDTPQGKVRLTIPPGTSGGTRLRLKGKGSPLATGEIGDLFVETRILVPKTLDEESRRLIEEFAKLNP
ncbi:MAG: J domain-containing protein [Alphaproteobacteria bacterium]|nr:J domain-containing protein [Alphaproteobacteria bacterium]